MSEAGLTIVGVPIDSVGRTGGTENAPTALRELGLAGALTAEDRGDLDLRIRGERRDPVTGILAGADVLAATASIRSATSTALADDRRLVLAGGCCALLPGALAGARDALGSVGLIHLDGHQDLYDGRTSPTGEAADMPISVTLGLGPRAWVDVAGGASAPPRLTVLLGYRDGAESVAHGMAQPHEVSAELTHLPIESLRREGPASLAGRVAASLGASAPIWLHLDVDVLDERVFPATDYLLPGGMDWAELEAALAAIGSHEALIGVSIACYNPDKDPGLRCGRRLVAALEAGLGAA